MDRYSFCLPRCQTRRGRSRGALRLRGIAGGRSAAVGIDSVGRFGFGAGFAESNVEGFAEPGKGYVRDGFVVPFVGIGDRDFWLNVQDRESGFKPTSPVR